jgi:hypothetical protein
MSYKDLPKRRRQILSEKASGADKRAFRSVIDELSQQLAETKVWADDYVAA